MFVHPNVQSRVKHYDLLLSRELTFLKREHSQNLITYQKLENAIRRDSKQISHHNRMKLSTPFDDIYHEQVDPLDHPRSGTSADNYPAHRFNQKRRLSSSTSSHISQTPADDFNDDVRSYTSSRHRRLCTKNQRLLPMVRAALMNPTKCKSRNPHWMSNFQRSKKSKVSSVEPFTVLLEETLKPTLPEPTPLERQVRSFLETLPTYKGVQNGFDSFAPASLYSHRTPIFIR